MDYRPVRVFLLTLFSLVVVAGTAHATNVVEGTSVSGAYVSMSCWNYSSYKYPWQSTTAGNSGAFTFDKDAKYGPCGSYYTGYDYTCKIYAYPNSTNSDYVSATSSEFTPSCNSTTTITLTHAQKNKTINVSLSDGVGAITSGITVYAYQQGGSYDYSYTSSISNSGVATLKAAAGKYYVGAYCTNYSDCDYSGYPSTYVTLVSSDTSASTTLTFKVNRSTLSIGVTNGANPISSVYVSAYTYSNDSSEYTSGKSSRVYVSGQTNSNGAVSLKVPAGTYTVYVSPPYGSSYASTSKEYTVGDAELLAITITLSSKNSPFTVAVKDENGTAISGAYVSGWTNDGGTYDSFWGQTSSSGVLTANGVEGRKYQVSAYYWSSYSSGVATSNICNYNTEGYQTAQASTSGVSLTFTFPICDHTLNFTAVDSSGAKISTVNYGWVEVKPASQSSSDTCYAGTGASLSSGAGSVKVRASTKYTATLYMWDSSYVAGDSVSVTSGASGNTSDVNLTLLKIDASIKGSFLDSKGNGISVSDVSYIYVYTTKDKVYRSCDVSSGSFTCNVSAGTWCLGYWVDYSSGYVSMSPGSSTQCHAVASGESLSKNLTLLKTGSIIVTVKDPAGSPSANTWVEATATSVADYGSKRDNYYYGQGCSTNSSGTCTIRVGASDEGVTYYVNAHTPYGILKDNNWTQPDEQSIAITAGGSGEVVLSFGQPDGQIKITIAQGSASLSTKALRHHSKGVLKSTGDSSGPTKGATVDIFSNSGAYATGITDDDATATLNCTVADDWYGVAYSIYGNTLYMSEATEITCKKTPSAEGETVGTAEITIKETATLPECQSKTFDASVATSLECTDGFSVSFPSAVLDSYGSNVSVSVSPALTPFKANERPATFYGYRVKATKVSTSEEIITLNGYATIIVPCSTTQLTSIGIELADTKCKYNDSSVDAYKDVACVHDTGSCKVTMTTNHLTDFIITGNGNLKGLDGTPEGVTPPEVGDTGSASSGSSGSCGCRTGSGPVDLPTALLGLLPFLPAFFLRRMYREKVRRDRRR